MEGSGQLQDLAALARRNKPLLTSEEKDDWSLSKCCGRNVVWERNCIWPCRNRSPIFQ
jgi:hypothetical protein